MFMSKKSKIATFLVIGILFCVASAKAATVIGNNITTMGSIGIGTTTPEVKLHILGDSSVFGNIISESQNPGLILSSTNADPENKKWAISSGRLGSGGILSFSALSDDLSTGYSWLQVHASSSLIGSQMNPFERVEIYPTTYFGGNVGIGTTTPQDKLEITGGNILLSGVMNQGIILGGMGTSRAFTVDFQDLPENGTASFNLFNQTNTTGPKDFNIFGRNGVTGDIAIKLSSTGASYFNSGNVGIGTTTPINLFSVASPTSNLFDVTSSGQIGVGTSNPISFAKMQINYDSASDIIAGLVVSDGGSANVMLGATSTSGFVGNYNNNSFSIRTNNQDRIFIYDKNAGTDVRFGFGTTTPESFFQVSKEDATTTVEIGSAATTGKGSCLKLRDSDGQGWTYCTTLAGALNCSTTSCE